MEILAALIAGAFIGGVLGFVGAGGAMLSVPILINLFDFTPHHATTAALAIVFLAAFAGAFPKMRSGEVLYKDALIIWGIGLVTNIGFSTISDNFSDTFIKSGFACVLAFAGISMLNDPFTKIHRRIPISILILVSLIIGAMTGIFGIGGGFLAIPILVLFFGTPQNIAAGTSLLIISLNSLTALLAHYQVWSEVQWSVPAAMAVTAVLVAGVASRLGSSSSPRHLRKAFAALLLTISTLTFLQVLLQS
jgi:uncharacterized membrane protein YfcA